MRVHQVVATATPRDAVTDAARTYQSFLRQAAPSELFALNIDPALEGQVHRISDYAAVTQQVGWSRDDVIVYHLSIGCPEVVRFVMSAPERLVVVYHNISPSSAFRGYDTGFADVLDLGREEMRLLATRAAVAITPSAFNARELGSAGYRDVRIAPLVVDPARLSSVRSDPDTARHLDQHASGEVIVFVGQLLPHKRPEFLLEAFHVLKTHLRPSANIFLVGASRLPPFREALEEFMRQANLVGANLVGAVSDASLVALLRRADLFATASEHEGFCVPLLESMAFDVPILARECAAIPETAGPAALLVPPDDGPLLFAEAMHEMLGNRPLREHLTRRGRQRLLAFEPAKSASTFLHHLLDTVL